MITPPTDAPEEESSGVFAPADSGPAETPPAVTIMPPSPEDVARDNARGGRWAMNEYYDGCVFLGADDRPVMRNDGSRVGFFFRDAQRLADELAVGSAPIALPSGNDADDRAAAWRAQRRALAPLDSGFNKDWDPQRPKSTLADMTKWTRLLAYHYVQTTEPEEAVRHAVSDIFGKPLNGPRMSLWVTGKYNADTVKAVADGLMSQVLGPEQSMEGYGDTSESIPINRAFARGVAKINATPDRHASDIVQLAQAPTDNIAAKAGFNNQQIDNRFDRKQWRFEGKVDERWSTLNFITGSDTIAIEASSIASPPTNQFGFSVFVTPLNADESPQASLATPRWFGPVEYSSGFTGVSYKMIAGQRVIRANVPGAAKFKWTIVLPQQASGHDNVAPNSNMLEVFTPQEPR